MYDYLMRQHVTSSDATTIADVGCENGHGVRLIRHLAPSAHVVAIDKHDQRRDGAEQFLVVDLSQPLPGDAPRFDYVFCLEVFEHIEQRYEKQVLENLRNLLAPSGRLFLSTPVKSWWNVLHFPTKDHVNEVEYPYLADLLDDYFMIEESFLVRKRPQSYYLRHKNTPTNVWTVLFFNFPLIAMNRLHRLGIVTRERALRYFDKQIFLTRNVDGVGTIQLYVLSAK